METDKEIEVRRNAILEEMRLIRSMQKGTINEQYFKTHPKGKKKPVLRGPYYVLSRHKDGKTRSRRLRSKSDLEQAQKDIVSYRKFVELCREFEQLTERLGELERQMGEDSREKKRQKSRSRKMSK